MFIQNDNLKFRRDRSNDFHSRTNVFEFANSTNSIAKFDNQFDEIVDDIFENSNEKNVDFVENDVVVENDIVAQLNDQFRRDRERTSRNNLFMNHNQFFANIVDFNDDDHLFDFILFNAQIETQIIFDNQIIDRRFSIFQKRERNHVEIKNFLFKHEKFHVFNSHLINKINVFIVIEQYFENKIVE